MDEASKTRARRRRKDERPEEIVEAAFELFAKNGYAATRLDDIAQRAGIGKGTIYLYFATKEALFEAVVRQSFAPILDALELAGAATQASSADLLRLVIETAWRELVATRRRFILRLLVAEAERFPELVAFYHRETVARGKRVLKAIVERGIARGELQPGVYAACPEILMAPVIMAAVWRLIFEPVDPLDAETLLRAHVEIVMRALVGPPAANPGPAT